MKKVGILTFHKALNYGALFQCYALQKKINDLGYYTEIINYYSKSVYSMYEVFNFDKNEKLFLKILKAIKRLILFPKLIYKKATFYLFIFKNIKQTKKLKTKKAIFNIIKKFDYIITGSDQVWNKNITNDDGEIYDLSFFKKVKKISYGASIGENDPSKKVLDNLSKVLKDYNSISVREKDILKYFPKIDIKHVIDPTFLISKNDWDRLLIKKIFLKTKKQYIFVYNIQSNVKMISIVDELSKKTGLKVVNIGYKSCFNNEWFQKFDISPEKFIFLLKNAEYVVTDSFHGLCFSLIYNKNFISVCHESRSIRQVDFLKSIGLQERICENKKEVIKIANSKINYKLVNKKIEKLKNDSIAFLKKSLE